MLIHFQFHILIFLFPITMFHFDFEAFLTNLPFGLFLHLTINFIDLFFLLRIVYFHQK